MSIPKDRKLYLVVKKDEGTPGIGWTKCKDDEDDEIEDFYYYFAGGNWPAGGPGYFEETGVKKGSKNNPPPQNYQLSLEESPHFEITDVTISQNKAELTVTGSSPTIRIIHDKCSEDDDGSYTVVVKYEKGSEKVEGIHCHPGWRNTN